MSQPNVPNAEQSSSSARMRTRALEKNISAANAPKNEWTKGRIYPKIWITKQADKVIVTPLEPEKIPDPFNH
jgi:hypothetical protein